MRSRAGIIAAVSFCALCFSVASASAADSADSTSPRVYIVRGKKPYAFHVNGACRYVRRARIAKREVRKVTRAEAVRSRRRPCRRCVKVTLTPPYKLPAKGTPAKKLSLQQAVAAVCQQIGLRYDSQKSWLYYRATNPLWVSPHLKAVSWTKALRIIVNPYGLVWKEKDGVVWLEPQITVRRVKGRWSLIITGAPTIIYICSPTAATTPTWRHAFHARTGARHPLPVSPPLPVSRPGKKLSRGNIQP